MTASELLNRLSRAKHLQETDNLTTAAALAAVWGVPAPAISQAPLRQQSASAPLEPLEPLLDRLVAQYHPGVASASGL